MLHVGDVVLVGADGKKRIQWPLGKIEKLNSGKDGEPRSALLRTARGALSRPLQRIYPLEVGQDSEKLLKPEIVIQEGDDQLEELET